MPYPIALHRHTPRLTTVDPRGLPVRAVTFHRLNVDDAIETRTERNAYDALGRLYERWDARLWADGGESRRPNGTTEYNLTGRPLRSESVDTGWLIELSDDSGQPREGWDGRGTRRRIGYDTLRRRVSVHEQPADGPERCVERFSYGDSSEGATNRRGRPTRHDDPAGSMSYPAYSVPDDALAVTQRFLAELATPDWPVTWAERDALLETDVQGGSVSFTTRWQYDATGAAWQHVDPSGHARRTYVDMAGRAARRDFHPSGATAMVSVVSDTTYDASGHAIEEKAGNGVVTQTMWSAVDGRLRHRRVARREHLLQDVDYRYDPVGNVIRIEDRARPTTWFDNTQVDPFSTYTYDTLYQLAEATGGESVQAAMGPTLPGLVLPGGGASRRRNYTQTYVYDTGGNLHTLTHAASDQTQYTRTMVVAPRSNRSLFRAPDEPPPDFAASFDASGNQQLLGNGAALVWDARNQLQRAAQVVRATRADDEERYVYGGDGMRRRKMRTTMAKAVAHVEEVRYLPGLALHRNSTTGESWEVADMSGTLSTVRWLHWRANGLKSLPPVQWRYTVEDRLASNMLELDGAADVISYERYYPYGGTAWWAARSEVEATLKTIRYSGKERDGSGLYYYGYRYYAPWLCRWIQPDPAGDVDGLNLYAFVGCNPVTRSDASGLIGEDPDPEESAARVENVSTFLRGIWAPLWTDEPNRRAVELLNQSIRLAGRIAMRAARNLREGALPSRQHIDNSLARIFQLGEDTPEGAGGFADIRNWAADQLQPIGRSLNRRLRPGNDGIVWYSSTGAVAQTVRADPRERIFVNLSVVEAYDRTTLAEILIHEESHFLSRSDTSDVRYLTATRDHHRSAPHRRVADVVGRYESSLAEAEAYIAPDETTDESRAELDVIRNHFGGDAGYYDAPDDERRMGMLMRNADTLAVIAMISGAEAIVGWDRRAPPMRRIRGPGQAPHRAMRPA